MKRAVFVILAVFLSAFTAFPQGESPTVEDVYLSTRMEVNIISELALGDTREQKLAALDILEQMMGDGRVSTGDIEVHNVLAGLAAEGTTRMVRENNRLINYFPDVRRRAAKLLGELGGENARDTLIEIANSDDEPMVLAQAVYGLGVIGINDNNESLKAIASVIDSDSKRPVPDNNLAVASLLAIERIAEKNGGFPDEPDPRFVFRSIIAVQQGNYSSNVRSWAELLLDKLRKY